jgi:hypothetical protein
MDAVALVDPAAHAFPAVQFPLQVAVFRPLVVTLNQVPAGQLLHDPAPARLYCPAGQIDTVELVDPAAHAYPGVQGPLQTAVLRPSAVTLCQVPAGQLLQDPAPARLYCPAGHTDAVALVEPTPHAYPAVHSPLQTAVLRPSVVALYQVPAGQLLQNAAPARLNWPAEQMDAVALVDPAGQEYPAVQLAQAPAPPSLYRPPGQSTAVALVDPGGQANPAVQAALQALARATSPLHVPAAQSLHAAAPARLNRPAEHVEAVPLVDVGGHAYPAVQWPHTPAPARLNWPAGQADAVALVEPAGHAYPAAHGPLQTAELRPTANTLNQVPAGQSLHAPAPARLYRPTGQINAVASVEAAEHAYPAVQMLHAPAPAALY